MQLARAIVFAKDVSRLAAFYRDMLDLEVQPSELPPDEWTVLARGGCELAFHRIPDPWNARVQIESPPRVREDTPQKLVFAGADVDDIHTRLTSQGVPALRPAVTDAAGRLTRRDFVDPEGNVFQIARA
jgi:catechol 2,3-dioxygenase-like lactoylglutathione lyase family enzyme